MHHPALDIRARYALAVVSRGIYGEEIAEEKEADVYFEAFDLGKACFEGGDPELPFLFRHEPFLARAWKDGFATGYENSVLTPLAENKFEPPSPHELFLSLQRARVYDLDGYRLSLDEHGVWVTNPYGVDCSVLPLSIEGCERILSLVANTRNRTHEWAFV